MNISAAVSETLPRPVLLLEKEVSLLDDVPNPYYRQDCVAPGTLPEKQVIIVGGMYLRVPSGVCVVDRGLGISYTFQVLASGMGMYGNARDELTR